MNDTQLPQKNQEAIQKLDKQVAVTDVKVDRIVQDISEIKNNHLLHINDEMRGLNATVIANHTAVTTLLTDKIGKVYKAIAGLQVNDAKQEPGNNLFNKIVEYVILGVIGIGIALIASR